jgi:hypothetical protein
VCVDVENERNWVWFLHHLEGDFPKMRILITIRGNHCLIRLRVRMVV